MKQRYLCITMSCGLIIFNLYSSKWILWTRIAPMYIQYSQNTLYPPSSLLHNCFLLFQNNVLLLIMFYLSGFFFLFCFFFFFVGLITQTCNLYSDEQVHSSVRSILILPAFMLHIIKSVLSYLLCFYSCTLWVKTNAISICHIKVWRNNFCGAYHSDVGAPCISFICIIYSIFPFIY